MVRAVREEKVITLLGVEEHKLAQVSLLAACDILLLLRSCCLLLPMKKVQDGGWALFCKGISFSGDTIGTVYMRRSAYVPRQDRIYTYTDERVYLWVSDTDGAVYMNCAGQCEMLCICIYDTWIYLK